VTVRSPLDTIAAPAAHAAPAAPLAPLAPSTAGSVPAPPAAPFGTAPQAGANAPAPDAAIAASWDRFVGEFIGGYLAAHPTYAAACGRHEFDGRLPDWSREGMASEVRRVCGVRRRATEFPAAGLDEERRRQREHVLALIAGDLFWREEAEAPYSNPLFYSSALDPSLYVSREYAPPEVRAAAFARYAREVPRAVAQARANLRAPLPRTFADLGATNFAGMVNYCGTVVPALFSSMAAAAEARGAGEATIRPAVLAEVHAAGEQAAQALAGLAAWFESERVAGRCTADFRLGERRMARMLQATEMIDVPLAEVAAAGRRDLERNLDALAGACARYQEARGERLGTGPAGIAACMARVLARKPPDGPVAGARRQLGRLRQFVEQQGLVSIPGSEEALVEEAPPHQRWNSAYIEIPGPYDRHLPSIFHIAPPDPAWSAAERAAYIPCEADLLFVSAHEVWPGHFLQFLHSNRASSALARLFIGYAFAEGWAHYSEELLWEAGFGDGDPETHIGQLQNALLRNVRLLASIGLHTGEMSIEAAEAMFREQAFQDPASARQQAARGTFDPAYLNYTLGKLIIRQLRQDWLAAAPGRGWREFHDRLLSFGGPPLPLVRAAMLRDGSRGPLL
jgi:hypothetical protein